MEVGRDDTVSEVHALGFTVGQRCQIPHGTTAKPTSTVNHHEIPK
jgi:hypothetical protein